MELFKHQFSAMASRCEFQSFAKNSVTAAEYAEKVIAEVLRIEKRFSRYDEASALSLINRSAGSADGINLDSETAALMDFAALAYAQSDGLFDITSGVLRRVWDFRRGLVPSAGQIADVLPSVGWLKVVWRNPTVFLPSGMELDFGGFGKEYAVDRGCGIAVEAGCPSGLLNLGGDVRAFGARPDGKAWSIGITHPRKPESVTAYLPIKSGALATSGDYERFFEANGKRYCHILNPRTGWPVSEMQSVSVFSPSCLVAGTLATIAMLKGAEAGVRFLRESKVAAMVIAGDSMGGVPRCTTIAA